MQADFRQALKDRTYADHVRVDETLAGFDLQTRDGFAAFLGIHHVCFDAMTSAAINDSHAQSSLRDMQRRIAADLATLGTSYTPMAAAPMDPVDPLAMDYIIEGSRLGSQVLKRNWATSTDALVRDAQAYFAMAPVPGRWRSVCHDLGQVPVQSARADTITTDTRRLFDLFYEVASTWTVQHSLGKELTS
ncbi:biliverdin-producing heme oxygenase [uncultured Tateyamaria sp.]|uniref:biliverdin-producing heme oxygenase n=1 Tax=uncultured Tateyamaria sp. TaxID=455651 RepID=UPI0026074636|nr:biliverdin-producing heme oxygenase [uncultured Tateyamaria sp.]